MSSGELASTLLPDEAVEGRFNDLVDKARELTGVDTNGAPLAQDVYHQAGATALANRLGDAERYPVINRIYRNLARAFPDRSVHNLVQNGIRVANYYYLEQYGNDPTRLQDLIRPEAYDEFYDQVELYTPEYVAQLEDPTEILKACQLLGDFDTFFDFNVQTTIAQRAAQPVGALALLGMQDEDLYLADMGCGQLQNLKMETLPAEVVAFEPVTIMERHNGLLIPNPIASAQFTNLINRKLKIALGIGFDVQDQTDQARRKRLAARRNLAQVPLMKTVNNKPQPLEGVDPAGWDDLGSPRYQKLVKWTERSFYLQERIEKAERIIKFLLLGEYSPPNIQFHRNDMTRFDHDRFRAEFPDFKANVVTYQTVFNQLDDKSAAAMQEVEPIVADGGVEIATDFMSMDKDGNVTPGGDFATYTYRTYVRDRRQKDATWQHFFTAKTSRVNELILEPAAQKLARAAGINLFYPTAQDS